MPLVTRSRHYRSYSSCFCHCVSCAQKTKSKHITISVEMTVSFLKDVVRKFWRGGFFKYQGCDIKTDWMFYLCSGKSFVSFRHVTGWTPFLCTC